MLPLHRKIQVILSSFSSLLFAVDVFIIQVLAQPVNQKTVVFLPRYRVYVFVFAKVKDTPVAEHPSCASTLFDVVVAVEVKQTSHADVYEE